MSTDAVEETGILSPTTMLPTIYKDRRAVSRRERGARFAGLRSFAKRLGVYLVTFFIAVTVNFMIPRVMPGDPTQRIVDGLQAKTGQPVEPATRQAIESMLGDPHTNLLVQYGRYWRDLLHGDMGVSVSHYPTQVTTLLGRALPWTIGLVVVASIVAWLIGVAFGALAGWRRGSRIDTGVTLSCAALVSVPAFWMAMMLQYVFAYNLKWLPSGGAYDPDLDPGFSLTFLTSVLRYSLLPGLTLVIISFASYALQMRNMMSQTVSDDFVLLGRAKGLRSTRVAGYAVGNAILPSVSGLASAIGGGLGGVLLIELIFTYPGLGSLLVTGLGQSDFPLIQGVFLVITIGVLVMNFIADSIYTLIDPRTREVTE